MCPTPWSLPLSLRPPRRIFARRSRTAGSLSAMRTIAMLTLGFVAAFGATVVAAAWPRAQPATRIASEITQQQVMLSPGHEVGRELARPPSSDRATP
jgi:hypothetical protein